MRMLTVTALILLGGCAAGMSGYSDDLTRLREGCTARGGLLVPTGASTGRPETEYVCRIEGRGD